MGQPQRDLLNLLNLLNIRDHLGLALLKSAEVREGRRLR
jgi:hypothetical protein